MSSKVEEQENEVKRKIGTILLSNDVKEIVSSLWWLARNNLSQEACEKAHVRRNVLDCGKKYQKLGELVALVLANLDSIERRDKALRMVRESAYNVRVDQEDEAGNETNIPSTRKQHVPKEHGRMPIPLFKPRSQTTSQVFGSKTQPSPNMFSVKNYGKRNPALEIDERNYNYTDRNVTISSEHERISKSIPRASSYAPSKHAKPTTLNENAVKPITEVNSRNTNLFTSLHSNQATLSPVCAQNSNQLSTAVGNTLRNYKIPKKHNIDPTSDMGAPSKQSTAISGISLTFTSRSLDVKPTHGGSWRKEHPYKMQHGHSTSRPTTSVTSSQSTPVPNNVSYHSRKSVKGGHKISKLPIRVNERSHRHFQEKQRSQKQQESQMTPPSSVSSQQSSPIPKYIPTPIKTADDCDDYVPTPFDIENDFADYVPTQVNMNEDHDGYVPTPINAGIYFAAYEPTPILADKDNDDYVPTTIDTDEDHVDYVPTPIKKSKNSEFTKSASEFSQSKVLESEKSSFTIPKRKMPVLSSPMNPLSPLTPPSSLSSKQSSPKSCSVPKYAILVDDESQFKSKKQQQRAYDGLKRSTAEPEKQLAEVADMNNTIMKDHLHLMSHLQAMTSCKEVISCLEANPDNALKFDHYVRKFVEVEFPDKADEKPSHFTWKSYYEMLSVKEKEASLDRIRERNNDRKQAIQAKATKLIDHVHQEKPKHVKKRPVPKMINHDSSSQEPVEKKQRIEAHQPAEKRAPPKNVAEGPKMKTPKRPPMTPMFRSCRKQALAGSAIYQQGKKYR